MSKVWWDAIVRIGGKLVRVAKYGAVGTIGIAGVDYWSDHDVDPKKTSCAEAPPPGKGSFTDWFWFNCEATGRNCTCDDIRDWLCALDEAVNSKKILDTANQLRQNSPVDQNGNPSPEVTFLLEEYKRRVKGYQTTWGPWENYNCNDDWFLGTRGRKEIRQIYKELEDQVKFNTDLMNANVSALPEGASLPSSIRIRPPMESDDGLDSSSIGMGLVLGGGLALLLLSMQPKGKRNGI